jgi:hypothetical protein
VFAGNRRASCRIRAGGKGAVEDASVGERRAPVAVLVGDGGKREGKRVDATHHTRPSHAMSSDKQQKLVLSIVEFLQQSIQNGDVKQDDVESLEVASTSCS